MNGVEAAVDELRHWVKQVDDHISAEQLAVEILSAAFVADYGCERCGGQGHLWWVWTDQHTGETNDADGPCPAEHVELPNPYGGVVYADPNKCEWRQVSSNRIGRHLAHLWSESLEPQEGRWVPKPLEVNE